MSWDNKDKQNARIERTMLGVEDHGIMSFYLYLDYGGSGQGFGGYGLDEYDKELKRRKGHAFGLEVIMQILRVVGVEKWEDLPGRFVRVTGTMTKLTRLYNVLDDSRFLDMEELAQAYFPKEEVAASAD